MSDKTESDASCTQFSSTETCDYLQVPSLPMDKNPATFWKENQKMYPMLAIIAKDVLGVPASSAAL